MSWRVTHGACVTRALEACTWSADQARSGSGHGHTGRVRTSPSAQIRPIRLRPIRPRDTGLPGLSHGSGPTDLNRITLWFGLTRFLRMVETQGTQIRPLNQSLSRVNATSSGSTNLLQQRTPRHERLPRQQTLAPLSD